MFHDVCSSYGAASDLQQQGSKCPLTMHLFIPGYPIVIPSPLQALWQVSGHPWGWMCLYPLRTFKTLALQYYKALLLVPFIGVVMCSPKWSEVMQDEG